MMSIKNTIKTKRTAIFKLLDYDLDKDERKTNYKDYDIVKCEKCDLKINPSWHCKKCFLEETEKEQYRMLYGKCNMCSQIMTTRHWCSRCYSKCFQQDFNNNKWTSGDIIIDQLILDNQTSACSEHILEWIPYEKFTDIKEIDKGGFAKVFSAIWKGGRIEKWDQKSNKWKRSGSFRVALKVLNESKDLSEDFLNELKFLKHYPSSFYVRIIECYGITREPETSNYALVLKLKERSLRSYLDENYESITLKDKLDVIEGICLGLNCLHGHNIIHRDLHPKNILHSLTDNKKSEISISDFGFCEPLCEISSQKIYGVIPYIAPEKWRGGSYTKKSDIYSFGIIINEILSGNKSFSDVSHDFLLVNDICRGKRPKVRTEIPKLLEELIKKCWDPEPKNRPDTDQIHTMLRDFMYVKNIRGTYNFRKYTEQYEKLKESSYDAEKTTTPPSEAYISSNVLTMDSRSLIKVIEKDTSSKEYSRYTTCSDCAIPDLAHDIKNAEGSRNFKNHTGQYEILRDAEKITITIDPPSEIHILLS